LAYVQNVITVHDRKLEVSTSKIRRRERNYFDTFIHMAVWKYTHNILTICSQYTHNILTIYSQYTHNRHTIYSQYTHNILTIHSQYTHNILTIYSQYTHNNETHTFR
jgi:NADH:ubiquinone oxidoreductase subunit E